MRFSCDIFTILDCKERRARGALIGLRPGRSFYFSCTHVKACGNSRDTKVGKFCGVKKKKIKQKISTVVLTMILFLRTLPMKATECNFSVEILIAQIAVDVV